MSEQMKWGQRWNINDDGVMVMSDNGSWVENAYYEYLKADNARLRAEVERLESDLKMEKENEDRLVRLWQTANNEVHGQRSQIAALIDNQTSLKAEVERLTNLKSGAD